MMAQRRGTPPWVPIGCGCCLLVLLAIGGMVAAGFFGASAFKGYVETMRDPTARTARAAEILGADQLPEGYTAHLFLRIPWLIDLVMASDSEPVVIEDDKDFELESEVIGQHLFVYLSLPQSSGMEHEEFERMLRGESTSDGVKTDIDLEIESDQELSRGSFELGEQELSYVGHRGELDLDDGDVEGIYAQVLIDCPGDEITRAAIWFQRGGEVIDEQDLPEVEGTPADEGTLRRFMDHFDVCAGR